MDTVRAVERAMAILKCFASAGPSLKVSDIEKMVGLSRPTLYRLIHTLEGCGMLRVSGDPQRCELDYTIVEIAQTRLRSLGLLDLADPALRDLWNAADETVALYLLRDTRRILVRELPSRQPLTFTRGVGHSDSIAIGATGHVMMAHLPEATVTPLLDGLDGGAALRVRLPEIRTRGFAVSSGEIIPDAVAIAAPIFQAPGVPIAAVGLFGPVTRLGAERVAALAPQVVTCARRISEAIAVGGHADVSPP